MRFSRRHFIKSGSALLAGTALLGNRAFALPAPGEIVGIQLYSIREDMKKDPSGTLKALAEMGYRHVEHANYVNRKFYGFAAKDFKNLLDGLGIKMESGHTVLNKSHWDTSNNQFTDQWKYTLEDAVTAGQKYVISPWMDKAVRTNYNELMSFMDLFNKCGELCKASGLKFGYHNHDFEFSEKLNDKTLYDIILEKTSADLVLQQLDIGNMVNGGAKAVDLIAKYPGRFESMHVKDEIESKEGKGEKYESTILGKGIVKTKDVIDLGRKSGGTTHFIIEQESYQGMSPMDAAKEDLQIMKKWGYS